MVEGTSTTPNKWAILIGIDHYDNPKECYPLSTPRYTANRNRIQFKSLDGCVNDACAIRQYLINKVKVHPDNITALLAPHVDRNYAYPLPPNYKEPSYTNLVKALQIPKGAKPNDHVYIHYSGHGARATTIFDKNDTEGDDRLDEALVPSDVSHGGCYLRDLEFGFLLNQMANAGLTVTAVLDSCHSGGGLRWSEDPHLGKTRGISDVYESDMDKDEPVISKDSHGWHEWIASRARRQHGFFALTACQASEAARERSDAIATHGLLTYWLLKILIDNPMDISSQSLFTRIISNVQDSNRYQTPHYVGDRNRSFFSNDLQPAIHSLTVKHDLVGLLNKDPIDREIRLDGGFIHGVRKGSVYAILRSSYEKGEESDESEVLARVQVTHVETGECIARALQPDSTRWGDIEGGCQAILRSLPISKRSTVCFHIPDESTKNYLEEEWARIGGGNAWLSLVDTDANFTITIDENNNFHITDYRGELDLIVEAVLTPVPSSDVAALLYRLEHLARLNMTKSLGNLSVGPEASRLIKVNVESLPVSQSQDGIEHPPDGASTHVSGPFEVQEQHIFRIRITNLSQQRLGCVIMSCASELGVHKLFPRQEPFYELEAGGSVSPRVGFGISPEFRKKVVPAGIPIVELVKVFVCTPPRDLGSLELQSLMISGRGGEDPSPVNLDSLLAELDMQRYVFCVPDEEPEWETEDLKFLVSPKI